MEPIPPDARLGEFARQGEHLCELRLVAMERGIETGDLRHLRRRFRNRSDRNQVVRLMQRRQRRELGKRCDDIGIDPDRDCIVGTAVHDPMPNPNHGHSARELAAGIKKHARRGAVVETVGRPSLLGNRRTAGVRDMQMW